MTKDHHVIGFAIYSTFQIERPHKYIALFLWNSAELKYFVALQSDAVSKVLLI